MNSKDRALCLRFLVEVTGRSNADAKRYVRHLGELHLSRLLENASDWKALGFPVRVIDGSWVMSDAVNPLPTSAMPQPSAVVAPVPVSAPQVRSSKQKKVMYSILLPPSDLEALRALSDETGEAVAFHVRSAIRLYLKAYQRGDL